MRRFLAAVALLASLVLAVPDHAGAEPIRLDPAFTSISAAPYSESLEDPSQQLTIDDVKAEPWRSRFRPSGEIAATKGMTRSAWWITFEIVNSSSAPIEWIAEAVLPLTPLIDFYAEDDSGAVRHAETGMLRPVDATEIERFIFNGDTKAGGRTRVYVRFARPGAGLNDTQVTLWAKHTFHANRHDDLIILGGVIGASLTALVFNFIFYRSSRSPAYGWYVGYLVTGFSTLLFYSGVFRRTIGPFAAPVTLYLPIALPLAAYAMAIQFSRTFLATRVLMPRTDMALRILLGLAGLGFVAPLFGLRMVAGACLIFIAFSLCALPIVGIRAWRLGRTEARIFTLAWSIWSIATFVSTMRYVGIVPSHPAVWWMTRLGFDLEAIILSFALFDQISTLRRKALEAERDVRLGLERANIALEAKVLERTAELLQKTQAAEALARTDGMTGIANRRAFLEQADLLLQLCRRHSHALSFVMVDIDHFKAINDSLGHSAGDVVIQTIAATLTQRLRATDVVGRIGGEEFALVMAETGLTHAVQVAEQLRAAIAGLSIQTPAGTINCTVSLGVAAFDPALGKVTLEQLMRRADIALYAAKNAGRNQVCQA